MNILSDTLQNLISQIIDFFPRFIGAIILVIIGFIISKLVAGFFRKILQKINIDKFGEKLNEIDFINNANINLKISTVLSKFLYYFLLLFFLIFASEILAMPTISALVVGLFNFLPKLIVAFIFLIFGTLLSELIRSIMEATLLSLGIPSAKIISNVLFYFLFINVIILSIAQAEINTEFLEQNISIIIAGGVFAFAIGYGLASKDVVSNFLSSLYTKDKVNIGDIIEINGDRGQVINLDKTSVTIASSDKKVVYPLKYLLNEKVSIFSSDTRIDA